MWNFRGTDHGVLVSIILGLLIYNVIQCLVPFYVDFVNDFSQLS